MQKADKYIHAAAAVIVASTCVATNTQTVILLYEFQAKLTFIAMGIEVFLQLEPVGNGQIIVYSMRDT